VKIKCQLDATEVFIADLIACSTCFGHHYAHHQELKNIIQWLLPVVSRAVVFMLLVWCGAEGYVSGLQDAAASCKPDTCSRKLLGVGMGRYEKFIWLNIGSMGGFVKVRNCILSAIIRKKYD